MQPNLKTFLMIAVMVVVALFGGLLYYLIYLNSGNQLLAVIFGGVVVVFGGYATVYLFGLADSKKKGQADGTNAIADDTTSAADRLDTAAAQSESAIPANLPKLLDNRAVIALLDGLRDAGVLDEQYRPMPNMPLCQKAYIAYSLCEILNTGQRWETFERFWQCSGCGRVTPTPARETPCRHGARRSIRPLSMSAAATGLSSIHAPSPVGYATIGPTSESIVWTARTALPPICEWQTQSASTALRTAFCARRYTAETA